MRSPDSSAEVSKSASNKTKKQPTDSSGLTTAKRLEVLFRNKGMTNQQVELWVNDNFSVAQANLGKGSLRKYLVRVLNNADLGANNRLLAAAQRLVNEDSNETSDIKHYWDELDKHFFVTE